MTDEIILPELLRRESRSFLQYVREAFPWSRGKTDSIREAILNIANAEADFTTKLGRIMQKRRVPVPGLGAFPTSFTGSNFLSAPALLPRLIAGERQAIADLERDLDHIHDEETRSALQAYRELKKTHLGRLEALA